MAFHEICVGAHGVDLAVMCDHPVGMRQPPLGESIGRIALVKQYGARCKQFVFKVWIESIDLLGQKHAFIGDDATR